MISLHSTEVSHQPERRRGFSLLLQMSLFYRNVMLPPDFTEIYYFLQLGLSKSAEIAFFPYFHLIFVPVNSKILLPPVEIYITFQSNASLNTSSS